MVKQNIAAKFQFSMFTFYVFSDVSLVPMFIYV